MGFESTRRVHDIKRRVAEILPEKITGKWEDRIRERTLEKGGFTGLNEMVSFSVSSDSNKEVSLHVHENLTRTPIEANRLMLIGLKTLADRMRTDASLEQIETVSARSWVVYNSPEILKKLGFTVRELDDVKETGLATMEKDDFVNRFGSKKENPSG